MGFAIFNLSEKKGEVGAIGATIDQPNCISDKFDASATMRKIRNILSSLTIVLLAVVALSFSGRYVAFITTCEGMGTHEVSINEPHSCCCSGDEASQDDDAPIAVEPDGCCKVEIRNVSVDDFSFNLKKVDFDSSDYVLIHFAPDEVLAATSCDPHSLYASYTPPDVGPRTGTDIIFTISRQLRI